MKFRVTFKDPDAVHDAVRTAAIDSLKDMNEVDEREFNMLVEMRQEKYMDLVGQFCKYHEYITIEFDTEKWTADVVV